jgi:glutaredoxin-related protein
VNFYRSLEIDDDNDVCDERLFKILERLAENGYLQNTRQFEGARADLSNISSFVKIICSMNNLEKLISLTDHLTLRDLALVFQSCSKLAELHIPTLKFEFDKMDGVLIDHLRPGFKRLRCLELECSMVLWAGIQEMLT